MYKNHQTTSFSRTFRKTPIHPKIHRKTYSPKNKSIQIPSSPNPLIWPLSIRPTRHNPLTNPNVGIPPPAPGLPPPNPLPKLLHYALGRPEHGPLVARQLPHARRALEVPLIDGIIRSRAPDDAVGE